MSSPKRASWGPTADRPGPKNSAVIPTSRDHRALLIYPFCFCRQLRRSAASGRCRRCRRCRRCCWPRGSPELVEDLHRVGGAIRVAEDLRGGLLILCEGGLQFRQGRRQRRFLLRRQRDSRRASPPATAATAAATTTTAYRRDNAPGNAARYRYRLRRRRLDCQPYVDAGRRGRILSLPWRALPSPRQELVREHWEGKSFPHKRTLSPPLHESG